MSSTQKSSGAAFFSPLRKNDYSRGAKAPRLSLEYPDQYLIFSFWPTVIMEGS